MNILLSGSSGFLGSSLDRFLRACGHRLLPLKRGKASSGQATWQPEQGRIQLPSATPFDAVIHLAGESIMTRWTPEKKNRIRASRVEGTRLLCEALANLPSPPGTLVSASAIGYYGDRGEEILDEQSHPGTGFLAELAQAWETATIPAHAAGIRVVQLRIGLVLASDGGALKSMLPFFKLGLGGRIGSGRQYWSWIALDDLQSAVLFILAQPTLNGPLNLVSPQPATNAEFTRTLARVLRRPALLPAPEGALRWWFGEMAEATLLASTRVRPVRLEECGFAFQLPELEKALHHLLRR